MTENEKENIISNYIYKIESNNNYYDVSIRNYIY